MHTTLFNQKEQGQQGSLNGAEFLAESESDWPGCRSPPRLQYLKRALSHPDWLWGGERLKLLSLIN